MSKVDPNSPICPDCLLPKIGPTGAAHLCGRKMAQSTIVTPPAVPIDPLAALQAEVAELRARVEVLEAREKFASVLGR